MLHKLVPSGAALCSLPGARMSERIAHVRRVRAKSIRLQAPVLVAGLRRLAGKITEPHREDDKCAMLEAAELIERMLDFVPEAERARA